MTLESIAWIAVALSWTTCVFAGLQLLDRHARRELLVLVGTVALGLLLVATRGDAFGFAWLRDTARRSDAIALGAMVPTLALVLATTPFAAARRAPWASPTSIAAACACAVAGTGALVLGRSTWQWDFTAVLVAGAVMVAVGATATVRARSAPNARLVFATVAAFGCFLTVGTSLLLVAWNSVA